MPLGDVIDWIREESGKNIIWYVKRLSANDTLANGSHQAGPYIPKDFLFKVFPALVQSQKLNPRVSFNLSIDSHSDHRKIHAIYYNNKTRNETRLTGFGGANSPLLDPDSTGSLAVFSFHLDANGGDAVECHVWLCNDETEEDIIEDYIGVVEPGKSKIFPSIYQDKQSLKPRAHGSCSCFLSINEIPPQWLSAFPSGQEILDKSIELCPLENISVDERLIKRRKCEFELFRSLEEAVELPVIKKGFATIDQFISHAQSTLQRRKSRAGRSLELHMRKIFIEEKLVLGADFDYQVESDPGQKPDFLFPSRKAYLDKNFLNNNLRMLAVKTTCKDRWRQILREANRIEIKHLLTLQEGVSENQFKEMKEAKVQLVVPRSLVKFYPIRIQSELQTVESFIADLRLIPYRQNIKTAS